MQNSHILLIYTGGTIGMIQDPETGSLMPFNFSNIYEQIPVLNQFSCKIDSISFEPVIDSSNVDAKFWKKLAHTIKNNYEKYDGFVILHGTDTMAFTASALSFMLEDLYKPVILTGSQLPIGTLRTDGMENLVTSIEIASAKENGKALVPEVCICFESKLYRGNRTTKNNSEHFSAYKSNNYPILAEAGIHIKFNTKAIHYPEHQKILRIYDTFCDNVAILKIFPNINKNTISAIINTPKLKGLIIETYGSGNAPTDDWFIKEVQQAIEKQIIVVNITQCSTGGVDMGRYETSLKLKQIGVVSGQDMTTEAAITKLMLLLGQNLRYDEVKMYMQNSLAGEITN